MMDEKTIAFFRFIDLRVYDKALDYCKWVITQLQEPRSEGERYIFTSFFKSANDIASNIAEGSSRNSVQFEHYLKTSKSALRECLTYTELCYKLGVLGDIEREKSHELLMELMRKTGALIVSLGRPRRRYEDNDGHDGHGTNGTNNARANQGDNDGERDGDKEARYDSSADNAGGNGDDADSYCRNDHNELSF